MAEVSVSGADVLKDIPDDVSMAREYAILGAYDVALQFYDRANSSVVRHLRGLVDTTDRNRWTKVKEDLNAEVKLIKELVKELAHFRYPPGSSSSTASSTTTTNNQGSNQTSSNNVGSSVRSSGVAAAAGGGGVKKKFNNNYNNNENDYGQDDAVDDGEANNSDDEDENFLNGGPFGIRRSNNTISNNNSKRSSSGGGTASGDTAAGMKKGIPKGNAAARGGSSSIGGGADKASGVGEITHLRRGRRGLAFVAGGNSNDNDGGDGGDEEGNDSGNNNDDGGGSNDGRWSPPPPLERDDKSSAATKGNNYNNNNNYNSNKARASSVGAPRGADVPAWDKRAPSSSSNNNNNNYIRNGGVLASNKAPAGNNNNARKSILPTSGNSAGAVIMSNGGSNNGNNNNNNNRPKVVMKAPLPPQVKRNVGGGYNANSSHNTHNNGSRNNNNNNGRNTNNYNNGAIGAGGGGGARPPGGNNNNSHDNDGYDENGNSIDDANNAPRISYSELNRTSPDFELIDRLEREILDLAPNVRWGDIAGLDDAKGVLQEAVVLPMMCPGFFSGIRKPWKGVLLYGPPGTGKTLLAKAVATECKTTFFNVSASSLASKWRGDAEKLVRILFNMAKHYAPAVLFFDEVDSIATRRSEGEHEASRRMKTEMLICMDGISNSNNDAAEHAGNNSSSTGGENEDGENGNDEDDQEQTAADQEAASAAAAARMVMVLGATNQPWELDDAFKRRFEKRIHIPLPGHVERVALFRICCRTLRLAADVDLDVLSSATENYSGADIAVVCKHAAYAPMRSKQAEVAKAFPKPEQMRERIQAFQAAEVAVKTAPITAADFTDAISSNKPSASHANLKKFDEYAAEHGAI